MTKLGIIKHLSKILDRKVCFVWTVGGGTEGWRRAYWNPRNPESGYPKLVHDLLEEAQYRGRERPANGGNYIFRLQPQVSFLPGAPSFILGVLGWTGFVRFRSVWGLQSGS